MGVKGQTQEQPNSVNPTRELQAILKDKIENYRIDDGRNALSNFVRDSKKLSSARKKALSESIGKRTHIEVGLTRAECAALCEMSEAWLDKVLDYQDETKKVGYIQLENLCKLLGVELTPKLYWGATWDTDAGVSGDVQRPDPDALLLAEFRESVKRVCSEFPVRTLFHPWETLDLSSAAQVQVVEIVARRREKEREERDSPVPDAHDIDRRNALFGTPVPVASPVEDALKKRTGPKHAVLFAEPGEGKTTLMRKLALAYLADGLTPIYLEARDWQGRELEPYIRERLCDTAPPEKRTRLAELLLREMHEGRAVLLLDALDEAEAPQQTGEYIVRKVAELARNCRLIVSCRSEADPGCFTGWYRACLRPLDYENEITPYVQARLGDDPQQCADFLNDIHPQNGDPRAAQLATSGICLAMMLYLATDPNGGFTVPVSREDLYNRLTDLRLDSRRRRARPETGRESQEGRDYFPPDFKARILEAAAFEALLRGKRLDETLLRPLIGRIARSETEWERYGRESGMQTAVLDEIRKDSGLLERDADERFRFYHLTLLEYFAARHMAREWNAQRQGILSPLQGWLPGDDYRIEALPPELNGEATRGLPPFRNLFFDPRLRETVLLLVGLMDDDRLCRYGQTTDLEAWFMDWVAGVPFLADLGLQALSRCRVAYPHSGKSLLRSLYRYTHTDVNYPGIPKLGRARNSENSKLSCEFLLYHLRPDVGWSIQGWCIEALGSLGDVRAVEPLLQQLEGEEEKYIRWAIVKALGSLGDVRAVEPLLQQLRREGMSVGLAIAGALDSLLPRWDVEALCERLKGEKDEYVCQAIVKALDSLGDVRAVEPLFQRLKEEEDESICEAIVTALGSLGDVRAVEPLLQQLEGEEDQRARTAIVKALGSLGDARAVEPLLRQVKKGDFKDKYFRWAVIDALDSLLSRWDVEALCERLRGEEDGKVREAIAGALDPLLLKWDVESLCERLRGEEDEYVCQAIVKALTQFRLEAINLGAVNSLLSHWIKLKRDSHAQEELSIFLFRIATFDPDEVKRAEDEDGTEDED